MLKPAIVFFGNERLATGITTTAPTLQALIKAGYDIKAVVSNYEAATSRTSRELEIKAVAEAHNIPLLLPAKLSEIHDQLCNYGAEAGVLVAYGRIVPESTIKIFPRGIINIHPSLLPLHRGPTPVESVILNGETKTGVSIMGLAKAMDAGDVYGQKEFALTGQETKQELTDKVLQVGCGLLLELLPGILDGNIIPKVQDNAAATYDKLIKKEDGRLDWNKPAVRLEREIRAYAGWPKSYTALAGKEVVITAAHTVPTNHGDPGEVTTDPDLGIIMVDTADGSICIDKLKPAGKNEMTVQEFLRGYRQSL